MGLSAFGKSCCRKTWLAWAAGAEQTFSWSVQGSIPTTPQPLGPGCLLKVQHGVIVRVSFLTPLTKPCVAACLPLSIFLLVPHEGKGSSHPWCNQCFASLRHLSLPSLSGLQQLIPHPHWLITNGSCNFLFKNYILLFPKSTIIPPSFPSKYKNKSLLFFPAWSKEPSPKLHMQSTHGLCRGCYSPTSHHRAPGPPGLPRFLVSSR